MELTERQKKALEIKNQDEDRMIYYEDQTVDLKKMVENGEMDEETFKESELVRVVADLDEVEVISTTKRPDDLDGRAYIPDWTPDWLYEILELWGVCEFMESKFEFASKEDADEFKAICDFVNE